MKKRKARGKQVIFSLICLVFGFIVAFSYSVANTKNKSNNPTDGQWKQEEQLRDQIIAQQQKNNELQKELYDIQDQIVKIEEELSSEEQILFNLAEDAEKYRVYLGKVKVHGPGVQVTLSDADYKPTEEENVNNYIVHEQHVFKVINELYISGASAVAINGQRLKHNSYILCNGPVITVDGKQFKAPFEITAIGDSEVLTSAMNITGGVRDQLVNENISFSIEKKSEIVLDPIIVES